MMSPMEAAIWQAATRTVRWYARRYSLTREDIEEATSEALLAGWEAVRRYNPSRASLCTWLYVQCHSAVLRYLRQWYGRRRSDRPRSGRPKLVSLDEVIYSEDGDGISRYDFLRAHEPGYDDVEVSADTHAALALIQDDRRRETAALLLAGLSKAGIARSMGLSPTRIAQFVAEVAPAFEAVGLRPTRREVD